MTKRLCAGFAALEVAYWCVHATFLGFVSAYLLEKGMSNTAVSLLLAAYLLSAFAGSLFWGGVCDRWQTNRKVFLCAGAASAVLVCLIYSFADHLPIVALCYPLLGFLYQPLASNADAWVLGACRYDAKLFGKIRCMPSLFYAFVCAVQGQLIARFGYGFMLGGGLLFLTVLLLTAWRLPDVRSASGKGDERVSVGHAAALARNRQYLRLLVLLFLLGVAVAPINNLKIIVYENVGGNVAHIGSDSFVGALTQVPLIALAGALAMIPLRLRYLMMTAFPLIMLLLARFAVSPGMVIAGTFFYNVGYGFLLPTMRDVAERHVDKRLRNLAHSLSDAVFTSFSGVVSLLYAGAVADHFGVSAMLSVCAVMAATAVVVSSLPDKKREEGKNCI